MAQEYKVPNPQINKFSTSVGATLDQILPDACSPNGPGPCTPVSTPSCSAITSQRSQTTVPNAAMSKTVAIINAIFLPRTFRYSVEGCIISDICLRYAPCKCPSENILNPLNHLWFKVVT